MYDTVLLLYFLNEILTYIISLGFAWVTQGYVVSTASPTDSDSSDDNNISIYRLTNVIPNLLDR